jgi:DNA polymerase eta
MLAKLASGVNKPNAQTLILPELLPSCLYSFPIGKIRGFGGHVSSKFNSIGVKTIEEAIKLGREDVKKLFGETADYVFERLRGYDEEEVAEEGEKNDETGRKNKSILSSKSMWRGPARNEEELEGSLEVIAIDLFTRMVNYQEEKGLLPTSLTMNYFENGEGGGIGGKKSVVGDAEGTEGGYHSKTIKLDLTGREEDFKCKIDQGIKELVSIVKKDIFPCRSIGFALKNFKPKKLGYKFNLMDYWMNKKEEEKKGTNNEKINEISTSRESSNFPETNINDNSSNENKKKIEKKDVLIKCEKCNEMIIDKDMQGHLDFHLACEIDREINPNKRKYKILKKKEEEDEGLKRGKKEKMDFYVVKNSEKKN